MGDKNVETSVTRLIGRMPTGYDMPGWTRAVKDAVLTGGCDWVDDLQATTNPMLAAAVEQLCDEHEKALARIAALEQAAHPHSPLELIEAAKKLPVDALGGIVTLGSPLWGWVNGHDGTPGEVHQQKWMKANPSEIAKCYPSLEEAIEAAQATRKETP